MLKKSIGEFEKNTIKVFIMLMVANAFGYLFQITLGHMLTVEDFGILNSLIALMSILDSPGSVIAALVTKCVVETKNNIKLVYISGLRAILWIQVLLICVGVCLTKVFSRILGVESHWLIVGTVLLSAAALLSFPLYGILQGLKRFNEYGIQEIILQGSKVVLCFLFVLAGFGLPGALMGIVLAYILEYLYCFFKTKEYLLNGETCTMKDSYFFLKTQKGYLEKAVFVRVIILIYLNMDVLLVKAHYSELETGVFSAGMLLAKIGMYLATALVVPLFPMVTENTDKKSRIKLFFKSIGYGMGTCGLYHVVLIVLGSYFINLVFGTKYTTAIPILPYICPYVMYITGLMILMNYFIACDKMMFYIISMFIGFFVILLVTSYVEMQLIYMFAFLCAVVGVVLIVNILYVVINNANRKKHAI